MLSFGFRFRVSSLKFKEDASSDRDLRALRIRIWGFGSIPVAPTVRFFRLLLPPLRRWPPLAKSAASLAPVLESLRRQRQASGSLSSEAQLRYLLF